MKRLMMGIATVAIVASAHAQAPFADVPRDHWSYEAVNTLAQRGIVIGYPDGTFAGKRAMTRYEFATAIARMIPQFEQSIKDQIAAANTNPTTTTPGPDLNGYVRTSDLGNYVTKDDFDTLKKLVDQFAPELQMLQVDVAGLRKDLGALTDRVTAIEKEIDRVKITGQADVIFRGSATHRGEAGRLLDLAGRPLNGPDNVFEAGAVVYNTELNIRAKASDTVTVVTDLNIGNYIGAFSAGSLRTVTDRSITFPYGTSTTGSLGAEITPLKAYITTPLSLRLLGKVEFEAGKTGVQFTPYTLKLVDYDPYTNVPFADNGEVIFTGGKAAFNLGGFALTAYAGTHGTALVNGYNAAGYPVLFTGGKYSPGQAFSDQQTIPNVIFPGLRSLIAPATQSAGLRAVVGTPLGGTLGLTYINAGINNTNYFLNPDSGVTGTGVTSKDVGRASVYGADLGINLFKGIGVQAEYANSDLYARGSKWNVNGDDNVLKGGHEAIDAKLAFSVRSLALTAGWKKIDPFFGAPGSWGAIGGWKNPVNIKGYFGTANVPLFKGLELSGSGAQYKSIVAGAGATPLAKDDSTEITHWTAGLKFNLGANNKIDLGAENVEIKAPLGTGNNNKAKVTYYNAGYSTPLSANSSFRLLYQLIDYRNENSGLMNGGKDGKGSVAVGQFTVKF